MRDYLTIPANALKAVLSAALALLVVVLIYWAFSIMDGTL